MDISEKNFEATIESAMLGGEPAELPGGASASREQGEEYGLIKPGGYRKRSPDDYDKRLCLIPIDVLITFVDADLEKLYVFGRLLHLANSYVGVWLVAWPRPADPYS